jgi:hypothetical protein
VLNVEGAEVEHGEELVGRGDAERGQIDRRQDVVLEELRRQPVARPEDVPTLAAGERGEEALLVAGKRERFVLDRDRRVLLLNSEMSWLLSSIAGG